MVLGVFSAAIFVSAVLVFGVQPMYAKLVLPRLGGSPAVWSVALVFFQAVLLLGYAYAHVLITRLKPLQGAVLHICVLAVALIWLPISYPAKWLDVPETGLSLWVLGVFAAGVGPPFFAVSANAPLLQAWFARSAHAQADDPYFLYAASNVGSLLALLSYPFVLEPLLSVSVQSRVWTGGYLLLCLLIAWCWLLVRRFPARSGGRRGTMEGRPTGPAPTAGLRLQWVGLAMVPSGLLVAVSAYLTTDLAAAPFLWVMPLALFLLTFIITFARRPLIRHRTSLRLHAWLVAPLLPVLFLGWNGLYLIPLNLAVFFISALVCHGALIRRRPAAEDLTGFYLWMSFGGVLGGSLASLAAPHLFDTVLEYPILLASVFLCRDDFWQAFGSRKLRQGWSFVLLAVLLASGLFDGARSGLADLFSAYPTAFSIGLVFLAVYMMFGLIYSVNRPVAQAGLVGVGLVLVFTFRFDSFTQQAIETERSFFGVSSVTADRGDRFHLLRHGTTLHGAERWRDGNGLPVTGRPVPLTYYHADGALAAAVTGVRNGNAGLLRDVAVIGLGTGSMACHSRPGESWRFFEIDPEVIGIARNPSNFRFLSDCGGHPDIVAGDGRLMLEKEHDAKFDLVVLDAFSSDSIPVHLMTREAVAMYFDKLKPGGALIFHISNRYMELGSVLAATAAELEAVTYVSSLKPGLWPSDRSEYKLPALVAVVGRDKRNLGDLPQSERWYQPARAQYSTPWTDDYSNVLGAIYRKQTRGLTGGVSAR